MSWWARKLQTAAWSWYKDHISMSEIYDSPLMMSLPPTSTSTKNQRNVLITSQIINLKMVRGVLGLRKCYECSGGILVKHKFSDSMIHSTLYLSQIHREMVSKLLWHSTPSNSALARQRVLLISPLCSHQLLFWHGFHPPHIALISLH
jgi:hypothetical protein